MGYTKRQFVERAFELVGYASYQFDLKPELLESAMRKMDGMMATWNGLGIRVGYPIPTSPENSNLDDATGVPDRANEAIYTNLAIRIAPGVGKSVPREVLTIADMSYKQLLNKSAIPKEKQMPNTLPLGAGNKAWNGNSDVFVQGPNDCLEAGDDSCLDFE